ncbi:MAG: 3-phosphoshikimate 1-carboxyvinyltransferase [Actinomycetaceae bacterium]|nr:3-phosphoshikimate 1-carboxyvinyltransferase [Actinomycetaceae bacterium]MDU0969683.1 3-phosphoshikimate 1-carboxyvinyltransferase [Actinomycetaceae bacterium]
MTDQTWAAPVAAGPLDAVVSIPGSKSETSRALALALLADAPTVIRGALNSRDSQLMVDALRQFGAQVSWEGDTCTVTPPAQLIAPTDTVQCGLAGTVMRFMAPVATLVSGDVRFDGDPAARKRPMAGLLDALSSLGAQITYEGQAGFLPFVVHGQGGLEGGRVEIDSSESSQFLSALILVAPRCERGLEIHSVGSLPSIPHVRMTWDAVQSRGVACRVAEMTVMKGAEEPCAWVIEPGPITGETVTIDPDLTNAGPFLAAPLLAGGQVRMTNWPSHTSQPGDHWRGLLTAMGGRVNCDDEGGIISQYMGPISPVSLHMYALGELVPTVAALAAFAVSPSTLSGIAHLRGHETDRLAALEDSLTRIGVGAKVTRGALTVSPAPAHGAQLDSFGDHRMAMFGAIVGLVTPGVTVVGMDAVDKTFPTFPTLWEQMVATGNSRL